MNNIVVSVIVPVYNVEHTVESTVKSIQNQTHQNLEIILVDDGSPDNSGIVCDNLALNDSRIKVIHQKNGGVSAARNTGIKAATSDYICFVDSDDEITHNFIEEALKEMIEKNSQLVVCGVWHYYQKKTEYIYIPSCEKDYSKMSYEECMDVFSEWILEILHGKLFSRKVIIDNGILFTNGITCGEDGLFIIEYLYYCNKVSFLNIPGYRYYCFRSNGASRFYSLQSQLKNFETKKRFLDKHCTSREVECYCAQKSLFSIRKRITYLAKKNCKDFKEINKTIDYYLPYFLSHINNKNLFKVDDLNWFEENADDIKNRKVNRLYRCACNKIRKEKRYDNFKEFKEMKLREKLKFIIRKFL